MKLELLKGSRSRILATMLIVITVVFIGRLFQLQILQYGKYTKLANQEQIKRLDIPAQRGEIYALDGDTPTSLVLNQTVYTVFADPLVATDTSKIISTIQSVAGGNARSDLKGLLARKDTRYQILATQITQTQAEKIKAANLSGIGFQQGTQRVYPEGSLAAQTLGFVNSTGVGNYGVEQYLNKQLTGTDGTLQSVTDVNDVPLTIGKDNIDKPAVNGTNEVLTIDLKTQAKVEEALAAGLKKDGATNGSVIVMNPQTGQVMAMASLPTFDPSNYGNVSDIADYNNPVISSPYEPGSDVKTLTMATGVDKGVVSPTDTYYNTDHINVDDITVSNADLGHTGNITFQTALNFSLNTGFVTVAERLGDGTNINSQARNTMYDYFYNKFRLGQLTGIQLANESAGTVIPPTSVQGNAVRYSNMAFGQGLDATMLQVAGAFSSIVNGGVYHTPTIIAGSVDDNGNYKKATAAAGTQIIKKTTADTVRQMTQTARGTLFAKQDTPGYNIGGKTGTSQTLINGNYNNNQTVGTYLGYGGDSSAKYVIMVQVSGKDKAFSGATDAEPIFTDISNWMINYLRLAPQG